METSAIGYKETLDSHSARSALFWVLLCAFLIVGSTFLPLFFAYLATPMGMEFQGILVLPQDLYGYLAKMQQGARGEWLFRLTYTSEDQTGVILNTFYLGLGRLSAALGLPLIVTFHVARYITGVFLLVTVFYIARAIFKRRELAWACFAIAGLSSGFGWLTTLFGHLSSDLLIPESVTYYAVADNPHFPLGMGLLVLSIMALWKAVEQQKVSYAVLAGLLTIAQALIQPFLVIVVFAISLCWLAWRWAGLKRLIWREIGCLALVLGLPLPALANDYVALYLNPVLGEWSAQNLTPSPPPYDFLLGYGILALLAALGAVHLWRGGKPSLISGEHRQLLLVWLVITPFLLYAPFSLQRRMVAGFHIVLSLFAVVGFYGYILPRLRNRGIASKAAASSLPPQQDGQLAAGYQSKAATAGGHYGVGCPAGAAQRGNPEAAEAQQITIDGLPKGRGHRGPLLILLVAMVPSNLFLLVFGALGAGSYPYPLYLKEGEVSAIRWLSQNTATTDTVLASESTGNIVPALAGNRVFYGHPFETIKAEEKKTLLKRYFAGEMGLSEESPFLAKYGIRLVYYGRSERELGSFDPAATPYLAQVFANDDVAIYRVLG